MHLSIQIPISEMNQVGDARRRVADHIASFDFPAEIRGNIAIVVSELASNLVKHARNGGTLVVRIAESGKSRGIEILSIDQGPGMNDSNQCMQDGYSTAGSPGTGLGAVKRLSTVFDIFSMLEKGTVILSQIWCGGTGSEAVETGAICLPIRGEFVSGDTWAVIHGANTVSAMMADGLGHGPLAAEASQEAERIFHANPDTSPLEILKTIHLALKSTRGAAVAIARVHLPSLTVEYCGVGNTVGEVQTSLGRKRMVSHNGTAGLQTPRVQEFKYPWSDEGTLILHSDGISTQWALEKYPGIFNRHAGLIAAVLYRDFKRGTDDVAVLVLKQKSPKGARDA